MDRVRGIALSRLHDHNQVSSHHRDFDEESEGKIIASHSLDHRVHLVHPDANATVAASGVFRVSLFMLNTYCYTFLCIFLVRMDDCPFGSQVPISTD